MRAIIWSATIIVLAGLAIHIADTYDLHSLANFRRPYMLEKLALEAICPFVSPSDHDYQACRVYSTTGFIYDGAQRTEQPVTGSPTSLPPMHCGDATPGAAHYKCAFAPVSPSFHTSAAVNAAASKEAAEFSAWEATSAGKEASAKAAVDQGVGGVTGWRGSPADYELGGPRSGGIAQREVGRRGEQATAQGRMSRDGVAE